MPKNANVICERPLTKITPFGVDPLTKTTPFGVDCIPETSTSDTASADQQT